MFAFSLEYFWRAAWTALFIVSLITVSTTVALAQERTGVGIKPATIEETADPGDTQTHNVEITNLSSSDQTYYLFTRDIVSVSDGGTPVFADDDQEKTGFEMSEWVQLSTEEINLGPEESTSVTITIEVPENATPGSHFGAMFVSVTSPELRQNGASIGYDVANIISIRVAGDAYANAQIRSFSTDNYIHSESKVDFRARVENKGTVLVRPTGPLEIYNMFGRRVATEVFNDSKAGVFPFTTREFEMRWDDGGTGFGRYQAVLSMVYGEQGRQSTITSTLSFWILPMNIIAPALGILAVLLLISYIAVKMYIRRTVQTLAGSRVVRRRGSDGISALLTVAVVMLAVTAVFLIILLALFA